MHDHSPLSLKESDEPTSETFRNLCLVFPFVFCSKEKLKLNSKLDNISESETFHDSY